MTTQTTCPSCGSSLQETTAHGLCQRCLLEAARRGWSETDTPGGSSGSALEELAQRFPGFEILGRLGEGGMGSVYRARHRKLGRDVALKLLKPEIASDEGLVERFTREARALAKLNHPGIVSIHDFGVAEGLPYVVMEYVDGPNLRQVLAAGHLPPEDALALVPQICEALQFAHDAGVVHRDVKPENVLLDRHGRVKVVDFGLAKLTDPGAQATLTGVHQVLGTPHYMAPEQIGSSKVVDHRADIYSLGILLYELLTGELPLGRFDPPSKKVEVDARLDDVVLKSLESEPDRRYQHASEVRDALDQVARGEAPEPKIGALDEDTVGLVLTIGSLVLVAVGLVFAEQWWAVLALYIPGMAVGGSMVSQRLSPENRGASLIFLVASLLLIGLGIVYLETLAPLWGLLVLGVGFAHGAEAEKSEGKKADEEPPTSAA